MIQQNVDDSTATLNIKLMDERIVTMSEHLQHNNSSITAAIENIASNTAKLAQETSSLSVRVVEHQLHLENLLGFEEAWRQQMDDHVKQMGELTALIAEVKSHATIQTQRVSAQLDGLRDSGCDQHHHQIGYRRHPRAYRPGLT
jgi:chromosome segregation ATPase